jgi:DNA-binding NtrC family response regulator
MTDMMRVLHLEDDFADAMLLQHALCDAGGFDIELEVARTLYDARLKLGRSKYNLIIADLRLPDSTDPNETVSLLEKHSHGTPVLVLTGSAGIDGDKLPPEINLLDKNYYFHARDDSKTRDLLGRVRAAAEDALML